MTDTRRGKAAWVHPTAVRHPGSRLGKGTRVWAYAEIRERAVIGNDCMVGNGVYVDTGVRIGDRCNIHNKALLYRNLCLEDDVFVGPGVCFTNDPRPRANRIRDLGRNCTQVGRGASIGANVTILPDLKLGRYCMVAAGSVVTSDVPDYALVRGVPARVRGKVGQDGFAVTAKKSEAKRILKRRSS
ncbi:MAG: N-acetyltransferase [Candidatus Omnitrophica bacterium]|nr:N-acetyltransferase [Candidatus Omnitrophota bacterium]